jgi:hypothetical protein
MNGQVNKSQLNKNKVIDNFMILFSETSNKNMFFRKKDPKQEETKAMPAKLVLQEGLGVVTGQEKLQGNC